MFTKAEKAHSLALFYEESWSVTQGESLQLRVIRGRKHISRVSSVLTTALSRSVTFLKPLPALWRKAIFIDLIKSGLVRTDALQRNRSTDHQFALAEWGCTDFCWGFHTKFLFSYVSDTVRINWEVLTEKSRCAYFSPHNFPLGFVEAFNKYLEEYRFPLPHTYGKYASWLLPR